VSKAKISLIADGRVVLVQAPYNADMIAELKQIPSKLWRPAEKAWSFKVADESKVREIVAKYFPEGEGAEEEEEYTPASNIMLYADIVLQGVRSLLYDINENGGKVTSAMVQRHLEEEKGCYPADSANVALVCIGKQKGVKGGEHANDAQFEKLVAMAKKKEEYLIQSILRKREVAKSSRTPS